MHVMTLSSRETTSCAPKISSIPNAFGIKYRRDMALRPRHITMRPKARPVLQLTRRHLNGAACVSQNANVRDSLFLNSSIFGNPFDGASGVQ